MTVTHTQSSMHDPNVGHSQLFLSDVLEGVALLCANSASEGTKLISQINREIIKSIVGIDPAYAVGWRKSRSRYAFYSIIEGILSVYGQLAATNIRLIAASLPIETPIGERTQFLLYVANGVIGDHLLHQKNRLALPMQLFDRYGLLIGNSPIGKKVVILIHGLCLSPASWKIGDSTGFAERYQKVDPDITIIYVGYNTGRRISSNGLDLAVLLQKLYKQNPQIESIQLVGHSMGGLVSRSSLFYAKQDNLAWLSKVTHLVCLGSPHHGAVLERIGFYIQDKAGSIPLAGLIAKLGDIRSAGIMDLRYGSIRHDDWEFLDQRVGQMGDCRLPAPLPTSVSTHLIAASLKSSPEKGNALVDVVGDYLVSIPSALGEHPNPKYALKLPEKHKKVFYNTSHNALQYNPAVIAYAVSQLTHTLVIDAPENEYKQ